MNSLRFIGSPSAALLLLIVGSLVTPAVSPDRSAVQRMLSQDSTNQVMYSEDPEVAVSGEMVHTVFTDFAQTNNALRRLVYRRSTDRGDTFDAPVILQEHPGLDFSVGRFHRLAVDGSRVHIVSIHAPVWDGGGWYYSLDYFRSTDAGATFEPRRSLATGPAAYHLRMPHITASAGTVDIAYLFYPNWFTDSHLNLLQSTDGGNTFSGRTLSRTDAEGYDLWDLRREGDHLAVAVVASKGIPGSYASTFRLLVGASADAGATWTFQQVGSTNAAGWPMVDTLSDYHEKPDLAWAGDHLYVTWTGQDTNSIRQAFVARSLDAGRTFGPQVNLSAGQTGTPQYGQATVAARGACAYVVWNVPGSGIWLRHSTDGGASWSAARRLFGGWWPLVAIDPSSTDGRTVHFLSNPGLYRRSEDAGDTLAGTVSLTTLWSWWSNGVRQFAWDIDDRHALHLVFPGVQYPMPGGDYDIHYRRADPAAPALGEADQCLVLQGSHEELHYENLQLPSTPAHAFTETLTVEMWVRPDPGCPHDATLLLREDPEDYRGALRLQTHAWSNGRRPSGKLRTTHGLVEVWGGELLADGAWHHLALTYDARQTNDNLRLYVDGRFSAAASGTGPCKPSAESFSVGGGAGGVYQTFRGAVDEVRLWNRALPEAEVRALTTTRQRGPAPGLVASYPLDGSTRETSGQGLDGVLMYREFFAGGAPTPLPAFRSGALAQASTGHLFEQEVIADWASSFSATGLPPGLQLDPATGWIRGTPNASGRFDALITASNRHGSSPQTLRLLVADSRHRIFRDDFDGGWSPAWESLPADAAYYQLTGDGCLRLRANNGDTWQHYNRPLNFFSIPAPGATDWTATLAVRRYEPTPVNYNSVHLVAWVDTDNSVRLTYGYGDGRNVSIAAENAQRMESYGELRDFGTAPFLLRLTKSGSRYLGAWSTNGVEFTAVSTNTVPLGEGAPARIGFWMGIDPTESNVAWIDSFEVVASGAVETKLTASVAGNHLTLAWPVGPSGAGTLEVSPDLVHWAAAPETPGIEGATARVTVPIEAVGCFFRVKSP